jgi:hypothetical protein
MSPSVQCMYSTLTLNLLTTTIVAPPSNASKWQMGFNSAFKGLSSASLSYLCLVHIRALISQFHTKTDQCSHLLTLYQSHMLQPSKGYLHAAQQMHISSVVNKLFYQI